MRHSRRADKDGEPWNEMHVRTWDPPLSDAGFDLLKETMPVLLEMLGSIDRVITSPFLRCLQTAEGVRKAFKLPPSSLIVDRSLSEIYDYFNSVRYVDSPDIWRDGNYINMSEWFFKFKHMKVSEGTNHLIRSTCIEEILQNHVSASFDKDSVTIEGTFPDFERYVPIPFMITQRFCEAFKKATDIHDGNLVFVTHMSGVISIINNIFGYIRFYIAPCDHLVLERTRRSEYESWENWNLVPPKEPDAKP